MDANRGPGGEVRHSGHRDIHRTGKSGARADGMMVPDQVRLLGIHLEAKRGEQAALRALSISTRGPGDLIYLFQRSWRAARDAEQGVLKEIRKRSLGNVIPLVRRPPQ